MTLDAIATAVGKANFQGNLGPRVAWHRALKEYPGNCVEQAVHGRSTGGRADILFGTQCRGTDAPRRAAGATIGGGTTVPSPGLDFRDRWGKRAKRRLLR